MKYLFLLLSILIIFAGCSKSDNEIPEENIGKAVEMGQKYLVDLGKEDFVISMDIKSVSVDLDETERIVNMYVGSELAESRGWTDSFLREYFIVVRLEYECEYDHSKTFLDDGHRGEYVYVALNQNNANWEIVDTTSSWGIEE